MKYLIFSFIFIFIFCYNPLIAKERLVDMSFQDNSEISFNNIHYQFEEQNISILFKKEMTQKEHSDEGLGNIPKVQTIKVKISINGIKRDIFFEMKEIQPYGQRLISEICNKNNSTIIGLILSYASQLEAKHWTIVYIPNFYEIKKNKIIKRADLNSIFSMYNDDYSWNFDYSDEYDNYPYNDRKSIFNKLLKLKECTPFRKLTLISLDKAYLYNEVSPNKKTKMYLIKGDKITLLDEKTDDTNQKWYLINYKGKKDLNMWIKAEAVDAEPVKEPAKKPETETNQLTPKEPEEITKKTLITAPPKNAEIIKAKKAEPIEKSASGSTSLTLLASLLGLLAWRAG